jgi:hypothetical protein
MNSNFHIDKSEIDSQPRANGKLRQTSYCHQPETRFERLVQKHGGAGSGIRTHAAPRGHKLIGNT